VNGWVTTMAGECHSAVEIDPAGTTTCRLTDRAYDVKTPDGSPFATVRFTLHSDDPIPDNLTTRFRSRATAANGGKTMYDVVLGALAADGGKPGSCTVAVVRTSSCDLVVGVSSADLVTVKTALVWTVNEFDAYLTWSHGCLIRRHIASQTITGLNVQAREQLNCDVEVHWLAD